MNGFRPPPPQEQDPQRPYRISTSDAGLPLAEIAAAPQSPDDDPTVAVRCCDATGRSTRRRCARYFANLASRGLRLDELVTETIGLEEINEGYTRLTDGSVARLVVTNP